MTSSLKYILSIFAIGYFIVFVNDVYNFNRINASTYETPWYDISYKQPYTNFILYTFGEKKEYIKLNVTEVWKVREVSYSGKTYWTLLDRMPAPEN